MEYGADVKVATIVLWNFFALIVNVIAFIIMYMKANRNASLKAFFVVQFSMFIWLMGKVFKTVSPTVELRWFFIVFYYFGVCLLEASFLNFSYTYYTGQKMKKRYLYMICFVALIQFLIVATNQYHHLFYSVYDFWGDEFGVLFYAHVVVNYSFIIVGMILCGKKFNQQLSDKSRVERNLISFAILVPLIINFIYITRFLQYLFDILGLQVFDITPIVYTWSILIFVYATFKYEFFDLTPIMKHVIARKLDTPILILDHNAKVLYTNEQFNTVFTDKDYLINLLTIHDDHQDKFVVKFDGYYYQYDIKNYNSFHGNNYIIGFTDITAYELAKNELAIENKDLDQSNEKLENQIELLKQTSHIGARNYIARELHDILGHALVVTIKLLEVSKMFYQNNPQRAYESLEKAKGALEKGFCEMREISNKDNRQNYTTAMLEKEIASMIKVLDFSGIKVNFFLRGKFLVIDEKVYDTLKKVTTELITNTIKHANASNLLLSIIINEEQIILQTMDNGIGVKNLVKGNGLIGIDGRLSLINGNAKYTSDKQEGFASNVVISL